MERDVQQIAYTAQQSKAQTVRIRFAPFEDLGRMTRDSPTKKFPGGRGYYNLTLVPAGHSWKIKSFNFQPDAD